MDDIRMRWIGEKSKKRKWNYFANLAVGKMINWPLPQSLLNGREGFGNSGCGGDGGMVFWVCR